MSDLAPLLGATLARVAAALADVAATDPAATSLQARLADLRAIEQPPNAAAFARAVGRACDRLRQSEPTAAPLLTLLVDRRPAADHLRALAVEELLLAAEPDLARLVECYRRELRPVLTADGATAPSWRQAGPALIRLFGQLLPQALDEQARLRRLLPTPAERMTIDRLRATWAAPNLPLAEQLAQGIIATNGAAIAHVQQTIVHGDLLAAPQPPTPDLALLYARYRAFVIESFNNLDFRGILQLHVATRIGLEQIYIPVEARPYQADGETATLHTFVLQQPLLVVLGDPGSGKSTLARYLLLTLTRGDSRASFGLDPVWLPIFFPVAAFAAARAQPGQAELSPLDYLGTYYRGLSQPDYEPLFAHALARGRALVLFDGLDEVRTDRRSIVHCLEAFAREWDALGNRFVATSRSVGYDEAPLDPALFAAVVIQPLGEAQIRHFIERWSRAYATLGEQPTLQPGDLLHDLVRGAVTAEFERRVQAHVVALSDAVFAEPHVAELARNPLLLTILALIHNQGARLPDRRVELYRLCVETLAETWNRARSLTGRPVDLYLGDDLLDERFVVNLLGPVALWLHEHQAGGLVEQDELESRIAITLIQADGIAKRRAQRLAQDFIELMRRDTGLLQERGFRRFAFLHLTFEEYLAARGLLESLAVENPADLLQRCVLDPRWREVVRLAVAAAPQREAQRLLLAMLETPAAGEARGRPVVLAGECLVDVGRNGAGGRAWAAIAAALLALLEDASVPLATRVAAGAVLGRLGDPRRLCRTTGFAEGCSDEPLPVADYWCDVSTGPFWSGDERGGRGRGTTLRTVELPRALRLARYPVTNAEYQQFIAAGGYSDPRWWTATGRAFLAPDGHRAPPETDGTPIGGPALWGNTQYAGPNQPVVGVSWYEAAAYCAWLTAEGRAAGWLFQGEIVRLPTALEWERAARHTDQRTYPWGDGPCDREHANFADTGLRAPSPVGVFPAGAATCGALDLAGNVWEWTASLADALGNPAPRADVAPSEQPAIKGGAFNWEAEALRCGAHYWFHPAQRFNLVGFRLAWTSSDVSSQ